MTTQDDDRHHEDDPSLRQKLHAATGDRDAEAEALADRRATTSPLRTPRWR